MNVILISSIPFSMALIHLWLIWIWWLCYWYIPWHSSLMPYFQKIDVAVPFLFAVLLQLFLVTIMVLFWLPTPKYCLLQSCIFNYSVNLQMPYFHRSAACLHYHQHLRTSINFSLKGRLFWRFQDVPTLEHSYYYMFGTENIKNEKYPFVILAHFIGFK